MSNVVKMAAENKPCTEISGSRALGANADAVSHLFVMMRTQEGGFNR